MSPRARGRAALAFATVVWGSTFVVVERALADLPVFHLLTYRFALGALLLTPLLARRRPGPAKGGSLLRDGLLVGGLLFAGYALQTAGLLWTTPSRSAFLTGLSVLLVPGFGWLAGSTRLRPLAVAGAALAAGGLWFLCRPAAGGGVRFNLGDALTVGCAAAFAAHVLVVERAMRRQRVAPLAVMQFAAVAVLSAPSLLLDPPGRGELTANAVSAVLITGVLATAVALACQLYAQRRLGAVETSVLLTLEPVVAALTSLAVGRERPTLGLLLGGGLIVGAMLLTDLGAPPPEAPGAATPRS